jgi:hypothetical protein
VRLDNLTHPIDRCKSRSSDPPENTVDAPPSRRSDPPSPADRARRLALTAGTGFIADLAKSLNVGKTHICKSMRGRHLGGTWVHWQIVLAYAKHLSPELRAVLADAAPAFRSRIDAGERGARP